MIIFQQISPSHVSLSTKSLVALQLVSPLNVSLFLDNPSVMHHHHQLCSLYSTMLKANMGVFLAQLQESPIYNYLDSLPIEPLLNHGWRHGSLPHSTWWDPLANTCLWHAPSRTFTQPWVREHGSLPHSTWWNPLTNACPQTIGSNITCWGEKHLGETLWVVNITYKNTT